MSKQQPDHLRTRVLTATVFVALMLIGMLGGTYTYLFSFGLINVLCLWEFFGLTLGSNRKEALSRNLIAMILGISPFLFTAALQLGWVPGDASFLLKVLVLYVVGFYLSFVIELFKTSPNALQYLAYVVFGIIYLGAAFSILNLLAFKNGVYQLQIITGFVLLVWTNDTAAYFVGSRLGKTPLFPRVSPKKTWEGSIGAALITLIIAFPVSVVFPQFSFGIWLCIAIIIFIAGGIGDLVESMFKRSIQIKDSSGMLPGHGGFLDRFDAFIFCVPFVAAFLIFTGHL